MKLIHYTISKLSVVLIIILTAWACLFYFNILDEILDETDDSLENYKNLIIRQVLTDTSAIDNHNDLMSQYMLKEIPEEEAIHYRERYFDSTRFYETELEFDPVRVLKTAFRGQDKRFYELTVMISTLEQDDMIEAILQWIIILYFTLLVCIILVSEPVFRRSLSPFYKLLRWLNTFTLGEKNPPLDNPTKIKEFKQLNDTIRKMTLRSEEMYSQQKQFIGNASHELQTPLAICRNKLELFAERPDCTEEQLQEIADIHRNVERIIKLNKSLLFLSRIENGQFHNEKEVELNPIIRELIEDFQEIYEHKKLRVHLEETGICKIRANESLANTLVTNLLKNAMIHTPVNGEIMVSILPYQITISNSGEGKPLDNSRLFTRFYQADNKKPDSTGLGLAIVQSIANLYGIRITYSYDGMHHFTVKI